MEMKSHFPEYYYRQCQFSMANSELVYFPCKAHFFQYFFKKLIGWIGNNECYFIYYFIKCGRQCLGKHIRALYLLERDTVRIR